MHHERSYPVAGDVGYPEIFKSSPVQTARGCRQSGLMVKSRNVVRRENKMKAIATMIVGMLIAISGIAHGSHGRSSPCTTEENV